MSEKICRALCTTETTDAKNGKIQTDIFATEDGRPEPIPRIIAPDDAGELWYWHLTPEDIEAERVAADAAAKAYRAANA